MIEVNLFSIASSDPDTMVGRCVARSRFDKEAMGKSIMEFVKGFLSNNLDNLQRALGNADLIDLINSDGVLTTKDLASINYCLVQSGYCVKIWNVADDEENAVGVPDGDVIEWNVIDSTFVQFDYPTVTKILPSQSDNIAKTLRTIVEESGLFNKEKFKGIKNPFSVLLGNLDHEVKLTGRINPSLVTKIYQLLSNMGFTVFCATSEV